MVRNFGAGKKWQRGVVINVLGSADYNVRLSGCEGLTHRHVDQMLRLDGEFCPERGDGLLRNLPDPIVERMGTDRPSGIPDPTFVDMPTSVVSGYESAELSACGVPGVLAFFPVEPAIQAPAEDSVPVGSSVTEPSSVAAASVRPKRPLERRAPSERVRRRPAYLGCEM